jgi:glycine/D-amino acid oxidase-like deaminating enzyme
MGSRDSPDRSATLPVIVIGAGVVGAACGLNLRRKGFDTMIVDEGAPGHGCSFGNAGAISPGSVVPIALPGMIGQVPRWLLDPMGPLFVRWRYLPRAAPWIARWLAASSMKQVERSSDALEPLIGNAFDEYRRLLGPSRFGALLKRQGQLYVWETRKPSRSERVGHALRARHGIDFQWLAPEEIRQLEPALAPIFARGLFLPDNGQTLQPISLVEEIIAQFEAEGGTLHRSRVTDVSPHDEGSATVHLSDGREIKARGVVVAAGAWSGEFAARLGFRIPLETERGYHVVLPQSQHLARRPIMHADRSFIASPMTDGLRIAGTVEIAGVAAAPDYRRAQVLLHHAKRMFPDATDGGESMWMGCRPSLPDSIPVIGRCPTASSVVFAFGHGHLGMTGAPMTGRVVAELIAGEATAIPLSPYSPQRFGREKMRLH